MKSVISGLEPQLLWEHFYEISRIPRCSGNEEAVRQYVLQVAERNGFSYELDSVKNVVVRKPATPGMEKSPVVVLQSHLDMVCEKNKDVAHDFRRDPIRLKREGDWLKAEGTTLGSDNGIGVAAALAVLESRGITHGPIEALFTVDEETGLTGATELGEDMLTGRILLNLDSEEDGVIYIGCAGGRDTEITLAVETEPAPAGHVPVRVRIGGLQGGHSGLQIHQGLGNAIRLLARFLNRAAASVSFRLAHVDGGSKHNAIPREADAILYIPADQQQALHSLVEEYQSILQEEYRLVDPGVFVQVDAGDISAPEKVFTESWQQRVIGLLYTLPHGVIRMSDAVPGLVETSTNLAVVKTEADRVAVLTSQRSSVNTALEDISDTVATLGRLVQGEVQQGNGYPAWQPNPDSPVLAVAKAVYQRLYDQAPEVAAIHAGLECGIIGAKYPGMDMISFGPTILGAHSPDERVQISTVKKFWDFLVALLEEIARK
ncbi:MAG: aminoacyl-histidine dipeptidase [Calditrichaeota bacterium]|nr:MAG: aminoacyl-histidine dipeptidase [Calditrichota bacterium]